MIPLNTYQKARLDVLKVFYRYHTMSYKDLKTSLFQSDVETIFKKWGCVYEVKVARKYLNDSLRKNKQTSDFIFFESYKDCIDDMLHSLSISDRVGRSERNITFCKKVKKAQERYYGKSSRHNLLEYDD